MQRISANQIRLSSLLSLVAWLSMILAGQSLWSSLRTLGHSLTFAPAASQPLVVDAGAPALLLLNADTLVAPTNGGVAALTARVRDAAGKPVAGVEVRFQSDRGTLSPATAHTDAQGVATSTFTAGGTPGQAFISALVDGFTQTAAIQIVKPNSDPTAHALTLAVGGGQVDHGQQTAVTIQLHDAAGQPVAGELVSFFGALGELSPASAVTDANGRAIATHRAGNVPGRALITALAGSVSRSVSIQVGEKVTPPTPPPGTGGQNSIYLPLVKR
jgi:hypothetical protein